MKLIDLVFGVVLCSLAFATSGCIRGRGVEIGGKLHITEVDERQESQATHRPLPWKCYLWETCTTNEVQK